MDTTTIAHPAPHPTPDTPPKPRRRTCCAACGEPSGSISAKSGFPVVRERAGGLYYHVRCRPGSRLGMLVVLEGVL